MAKTDYHSIDQYHAAFSGEALVRMRQLRSLIKEIAPEAKELISYQIPAFKIADRAYLIYYCAFTKHISLSSPWSKAFLEAFASELLSYKVSKSVIQFPLNEAFPMDLIRRMILVPEAGSRSMVTKRKKVTGIHLTFSGNCREAMTFYRDCFGGELTIQEFEGPLFRYPQLPVVSARLTIGDFLMCASDLVPDEGRILGNYMSIYRSCKSEVARFDWVHKLSAGRIDCFDPEWQDQIFIELSDPFDVRWIIGLE